MRITQVSTLQKPGSVSTHRKYRIITVMEAMKKLFQWTSNSFFKHSNYNFQKSRSIEKLTPPFKSQQLLSVPFGLAVKHPTLWARRSFMRFVRFSEQTAIISIRDIQILFMTEGRVYRAVQTESSNMIKLNLVFKLSEFCHNSDLQTENLNRMPNFLVCCMPPAVHFLLPSILPFL
jgi:hypothetical protein